VLDAGGVVVEVLQSSRKAEPTLAELDAWITTYELPVTSVMDRDPDAETETFDALGVREQIFIVELSTMKIVFQVNGSTAGIGDPSAKTAIDHILTLL
jgi:hypothetical protein